MQCFCSVGETVDIKVEGDVCADPIWCNQCGANLDLEETSLSEELKGAMEQWALEYGNWINWDKDELLPNGIMLEDDHNHRGIELTEKLKQELNGEYKVGFSPSSMARMYVNKNF